MSSTSINLPKFLGSISLFQRVDSEILSLLAEKFTPLTVAPYETLFQEGEPGHHLYVLQAGKLNTFLKNSAGEEMLIASHEPGDSVGEIALFTNTIRSTTVRTAEPSQLWQLSRLEFEQVSDHDPALCSAVERAVIGQLQRAKLRAALYKNRLFPTLEESVVHDLERVLEPVLLADGETLLHVGDPSDALYIVLHGRLRVVTTTREGTERHLNELGCGQVVGEMGLIAGEPRCATIYALRNTLLGRLDSNAFYGLLQKHPQALTRLFSSRLISDVRNEIESTKDSIDQNSTHRGASLRTMALVAIDPAVPLAEFAARLTRALSAHGATLHISDTLTDQTLGQTGVAHAPLGSAGDNRIALWFGEEEARQDYLIYAGDQPITKGAFASPWTKRCGQQADHILYVAWADSEPESIVSLQASETGHRKRSTLVLLHPADRRIPVGTQRWLDWHHFDGHHHVRWAVDEDMVRLARLLTGRGIGLVLSGGGARGFAHVGVIRALQEADIPIDLIGGTSIGAIVGGLLAMGRDADAITNELGTCMGKRKDVMDYTPPITSLFAGKKFEILTQRLFGCTEIVDTWRTFFCMTTDITCAAEVSHRSGPMWKYIRASSSLPIAFPPQVDGNNLLVDGSFMNNYPVNIMHNSDGCGTIIGVNVCLEFDMYNRNQYGNSLSGWEILKSKLNPFASPVNAPRIVDVVNRLNELNSAERSQRQRDLTDLYIRPPIHKYSGQAFEKHPEIIEAGYRAAQPLIANWLASATKRA